MTTTKRAILYARVSSDEQSDKGYSLPSQIEACRRYAEAQGYVIAAVFKDDCSGTIHIAERPQGKRAAQMLKQGEAEAIVVFQIDRLSREIVDLLTSVRDWVKARIEVHSCDMGKISSELDIVLVIKGWQGSDERKKIIERTSRGRTTKARTGKVVGAGRTPYGYAYQDGTFVIVESEAPIVKLIYRWYTQGDGEAGPLPHYAIARRLSEMSVPTPAESRVPTMRRRGNGMWNASSINHILRSETYAGVWRYGKRVGKSGKDQERRPVEEQIVVAVPAIIERDMWETAQHRRVENKRLAARNCHCEYLLRGMIRCECDFMMSARSYKPSRNRAYRCTWYKHRHVSLEGVRCTQRPVNADLVEAKAWDYVMGLWTNEAEFERKLLEAQQAELQGLGSKQEQLATVQTMLTECQAEADKFAFAFAKVPGGIVGKALAAQIDEIEKRHAALVTKSAALERELSTRNLSDVRIRNALQFRADVVFGMQNPTAEDKGRNLELLQVMVNIKEGKATVSCVIPGCVTSFTINSGCRK